MDEVRRLSAIDHLVQHEASKRTRILMPPSGYSYTEHPDTDEHSVSYEYVPSALEPYLTDMERALESEPLALRSFSGSSGDSDDRDGGKNTEQREERDTDRWALSFGTLSSVSGASTPLLGPSSTGKRTSPAASYLQAREALFSSLQMSSAPSFVVPVLDPRRDADGGAGWAAHTPADESEERQASEEDEHKEEEEEGGDAAADDDDEEEEEEAVKEAAAAAAAAAVPQRARPTPNGRERPPPSSSPSSSSVPRRPRPLRPSEQDALLRNLRNARLASERKRRVEEAERRRENKRKQKARRRVRIRAAPRTPDASPPLSDLQCENEKVQRQRAHVVAETEENDRSPPQERQDFPNRPDLSSLRLDVLRAMRAKTLEMRGVFAVEYQHARQHMVHLRGELLNAGHMQTPSRRRAEILPMLRLLRSKICFLKWRYLVQAKRYRWVLVNHVMSVEKLDLVRSLFSAWARETRYTRRVNQIADLCLEHYLLTRVRGTVAQWRSYATRQADLRRLVLVFFKARASCSSSSSSSSSNSDSDSSIKSTTVPRHSSAAHVASALSQRVMLRNVFRLWRSRFFVHYRDRKLCELGRQRILRDYFDRMRDFGRSMRRKHPETRRQFDTWVARREARAQKALRLHLHRQKLIKARAERHFCDRPEAVSIFRRAMAIAEWRWGRRDALALDDEPARGSSDVVVKRQFDALVAAMYAWLEFVRASREWELREQTATVFSTVRAMSAVFTAWRRRANELHLVKQLAHEVEHVETS